MSDRTRRILHIIPQLGIGGAERQLYTFIYKSDPKKFTHEIIYYSDSNDTKGFSVCDKLGINYYRITRHKFRLIQFLLNLSQEIQKRSPDIVHCWLYSGVIWGRWAAIIAGVKNIIVTYRSSHFIHTKILKLLEKLTSKKVVYLANSKACAAAAAKALGVSQSKFNVIYNGVELAEKTPDSSASLRSELNIPENISIVTMVGRLTFAKNYPMLLKLAAKCKQEKLPVRFVIVGHGELEGELKQLANDLKIADFVYFLGLRDDVQQILSKSDVFCFTSLYEGFPNALLEAMLAKLPIIASKFKGVEELITDGVNGQLVEIGEINAAYHALYLFLTNPDISRKFANEAYVTAMNNFSVSQMVDSTEKLYNNILRG